jgi:ABC-2 type transport system ATP-binding protein
MPDAIAVRGLNYGTRGFTLRDIALNVSAGSIYGFLGPNGAGKTTTIRLLLGMTRPKSGSIELLGRRVPDELPQALLRTGYVPERPHLYRALTVAEAIRYHAAFFPSWNAEWETRLRSLFELPADRRVGRLSKGEAGKLAILLALAQRPELLILDEPTDGLDPMVRRDVMSAVLDYVADTGATVFISSHLVHELERICDHVGVLDHGQMVAEMPMAAFKDGVKRVRVVHAADADTPHALAATSSAAGAAVLTAPASANFAVLSRTTELGGHGELWVVRGWSDAAARELDARGTAVREVMDMDLEEVFVELLRSSRKVMP